MKFFFPFLLFFMAVASCESNTEKLKEINWTKKQSTELNKNLALDEDLDIRMYLEQRKKWKMTETGTGLRYFIYKAGMGDSARSGLIAQVQLKMEGLDGTIYHETAQGELESFKIDKSQIETGIQEGIKKMRIGDEAKLIVPSHLGHGLVGDFDQIPPLTTLVIDIKLKGLIQK